MLNPTLSISIMAHPSREKYFPYLFQKLGPVPISIDGGWGIWENARRAWKMYDPKATYHVVVQDDAIICQDFKNKAREVLDRSDKIFKHHPHLVNFYYDQMFAASITSKDPDGFEYINRSRIHWAVAICVPVNLIEPMLAFCDQLTIPTDDERVTLFMQSQRIKAYFPIPCLINHRTDTPSLIGNTSERKAWRFIE